MRGAYATACQAQRDAEWPMPPARRQGHRAVHSIRAATLQIGELETRPLFGRSDQEKAGRGGGLQALDRADSEKNRPFDLLAVSGALCAVRAQVRDAAWPTPRCSAEGSREQREVAGHLTHCVMVNAARQIAG